MHVSDSDGGTSPLASMAPGALVTTTTTVVSSLKMLRGSDITRVIINRVQSTILHAAEPSIPHPLHHHYSKATQLWLVSHTSHSSMRTTRQPHVPPVPLVSATPILCTQAPPTLDPVPSSRLLERQAAHLKIPLRQPPRERYSNVVRSTCQLD